MKKRAKRPALKARKPKVQTVGIAPRSVASAEEMEECEFDRECAVWEAKHTKSAEPVWSSNPIVAAVQRLMWRRGDLHISAPKGMGGYQPEAMRSFIDRVFDEKAQRELAALMIEALLTGDRGFTKMLNQALKESDHLFHRDREIAVLAKFAKLAWSLPKSSRTKKEITKLFAQRNQGRTLDDHQWRRLRAALNLPTSPAGRPKK
jgi:hypothetical protein